MEILYAKQTANFPPETKTERAGKGRTHQEIKQEKELIMAKIRPRGKLKEAIRKHDELREKDLLDETLTIW